MNKLLVCVVLALMVLQCVVAGNKSVDALKIAEGSASAMVPTPLLQLGMTVVPALLYKLL
ncbi:hypothetical protein ANANG_G00026540 [Anguilla anguilla]|uniref:Uncharacterized protein n=1 Tax=Anguilla anguilla TaxID=7936 RepID=A0A9D3S7X5_ANGAN|nr:hypothetical protein ANANG_G00026540 [Anguilla anguilla]